MKCPKCHYLSFEPEPRCRHCGHDLSLPDVALPLIDPTPAPLSDLTLREAPRPRREQAPATLGLIRPADVMRSSEAAARPGPVTAELPLFVRPAPAIARVAAESAREPEPTREPEPAREPDARPESRIVVAEPAEVKRPVAAMRSDVPRKMGPLDRDLLEDLKRIEVDQMRRTRAASAAAPVALAHDADAPAAPRTSRIARLAAAVVDLSLLVGLNAAIVWLTLRQTELALAEVPAIALAPLLGFLWLVDLGYLMMFTASGGQTIGKMLLRLRVIDEVDERLSWRRAAYRALLTFPSVLALGAGFLPAIFGGGVLHDRLSHTRVVRA